MEKGIAEQEVPKLGLYHAKEARIPWDYHDLLHMIAPRRVLVHAPGNNRTGFSIFGEVATL